MSNESAVDGAPQEASRANGRHSGGSGEPANADQRDDESVEQLEDFFDAEEARAMAR